jgi:transcriptional regulator with PAS, ATPase and Fis domain
MKDALTALLEYKNLGTILFDSQFNVLAIDKVSERILNSIGQKPLKLNLTDFFPEFIGSEDFIQNIVTQKKNSYRLDFINRTDKENHPCFLNIIVLPQEKPGNGLLIIENVTEQALAMQNMNQQKYELLLYKRDLEFRKQFLAESILGKSKVIQQIRETIQTLSRVPTATVLLI